MDKKMFSSLQTMVPGVPRKANKCAIIDETVKYIKTLEKTLKELEKQKQENLRTAKMADNEPAITSSSAVQPTETDHKVITNPPHPVSVPLPQGSFKFQTWHSPNVVVSMCGNNAYMSICSSREPGLLVTIFDILEKRNLEVVSAQISSNENHNTYMIHVNSSGASDQLPEALSVEETFKLVAGEINFRLSRH